jgi:putative transposase
VGASGVSKSQVSRLCEEIDARVKAFLDRPLESEWPYVWLDATYVKVRGNHRIVSVAVIIAVGVNADGRREVLGMDIGPSEATTFWDEFLRKLARRGLRGVKLVISDAHEGLKAAVAKVLGASWQRCRVHFMRNALALSQQTRPSRRLCLHRYGFRAGLARRRRQAMAPGRRSAARQAAQARKPSSTRPRSTSSPS